MEQIKNKVFEEERALYGVRDVVLTECKFDGPEDGESALKEGKNIVTENCFFNLRYPFWHDNGLSIKDSEMTSLCRAALWYSNSIQIARTKLHGIKALRECSNVIMKDCDVISPEFGWSTKNITMESCTAESEYFMMRSENLNFHDVNFKGKYSFQYIVNATFENCVLDTKDAFWHSKNVTVKNCTVKGEYLAWYSDHLTLIDCKIIGTQPFCYCTNLKLVNCEMIQTDLCFEKSDVDATITTEVISIKNPKSGKIVVPYVDEVIRDEEDALGEIEIRFPERTSNAWD